MIMKYLGTISHQELPKAIQAFVLVSQFPFIETNIDMHFF